MSNRLDAERVLRRNGRMGEAGQALFRSEDLRVRFVPASAAASAVCFVTFGSYTNEYTLDRQGFAEEFLRGEGIDTVHVVNRDNRWYQYPEMDEALAAAATVTRRYARVFTYGSSMGGYAALRFARALGAPTAIAVSPQFSLDPRVVPFEERWQADVPAITFREAPIAATHRQVIFYDSRMRLDARHFEMFAALPTETIGVPIPYAGHPVGPLLAETGVLKDSIRAIIAGRFDAARVQRAVRERRRRSAHHFFTLARRAEPRHPDIQIAMLRRAVAIRPESHTLSELAWALDRKGEHAMAGPLHREALRLVPDNARARAGYACHLEATGRIREAAAEFRRALAGQGASVRLYVRTVQARFYLRRLRLHRIEVAFDRWLSRNVDTPRYARIARRLGRFM